MKAPAALVASAALVMFALGCGRTAASTDQPVPAASSTSILRGDRLQKMPGATAFDALQMMATYMSRTMRQPAPRLVLVLDGTLTSNIELLKSIQASDVFEIRVVGESQSLGDQGGVEIVVTTVARQRSVATPGLVGRNERPRGGCCIVTTSPASACPRSSWSDRPPDSRT